MKRQKSGFVALVGRSNVGKSTLLNTLVGTKIAGTSFKPQMTRHIIHGVMNYDGTQAIFVDMPGIFKHKKSSLSAKLLGTVKEAIKDIDILIYVVDPTREIGDEEKSAFGMVRHMDLPKILIINKSDLPKNEKKYQTDYEKMGEEFDFVFNLSALKASHIAPLKEKVAELLPEGEQMYPDWQLTNVNKEFFVAEIIREKVFSVLDKELPYSVTVEVEEIAEKEDITIIKAKILTNQTRYKKMIIGKNGAKIKEIGQMARRELEQSANKKIFLDLEVEVDTHWVERL